MHDGNVVQRNRQDSRDGTRYRRLTLLVSRYDLPFLRIDFLTYSSPDCSLTFCYLVKVTRYGEEILINWLTWVHWTPALYIQIWIEFAPKQVEHRVKTIDPKITFGFEMTGENELSLNFYPDETRYTVTVYITKRIIKSDRSWKNRKRSGWEYLTLRLRLITY